MVKSNRLGVLMAITNIFTLWGRENLPLSMTSILKNHYLFIELSVALQGICQSCTVAAFWMLALSAQPTANVRQYLVFVCVLSPLSSAWSVSRSCKSPPRIWPSALNWSVHKLPHLWGCGCGCATNLRSNTVHNKQKYISQMRCVFYFSIFFFCFYCSPRSYVKFVQIVFAVDLSRSPIQL